MHLYHALDRVLGRVVVALAEHGVVHLLRGWIFPIGVGVAAGDGGGGTVGGKGVFLVGGSVLGERWHVVERVEL